MKREDWLLAQKTRRFFITEQEKGFLKEIGRMSNPGWDGMCSTFCLTFPDKNWMHPHDNCYSGLSSHYTKDVGAGAVALVVGITEHYASGTTPYELRLPYLDWVLNESPWADSFVTKSAAQCLRMHTVVQDTTVPGNMMVGGAVAIRRMWEQTSIFYVWNDLVKAGVNKHLAYILGHIASADFDGVGKSKTLSWNNTQEGGHQNLSLGQLSKSFALNFMKGVYNEMGSYKEGRVYTGYSYMFETGNNTNKGNLAKWVVDNFPNHPEKEEVKEVVQAVVNPFAAAMPKKPKVRARLSYDVALKRMVEFAPLILKEIGYEQR